TTSLDGIATSSTIYNVGGQFVFTDNNTPGIATGHILSLTGKGLKGAPDFPLNIDFSGLNTTSNVTASADGQNKPSVIASTQMTLAGNVNEASATITSTATVYTPTGTAVQLTTTLTPLAS